MKGFSDLDLNKMIAELEGEKFIVYENRALLHENDQGHMFENNMTMDWYNPVKDWRILAPLMVKYKVNVIHHDEEIEGDGDYYEVWIDGTHPKNTTLGHPSHLYECNLPRAIIECILKSKNII